MEEGEEPEDLRPETKEKDWIDGEWKDVEMAPEENLDEDEIKGKRRMILLCNKKLLTFP